MHWAYKQLEEAIDIAIGIAVVTCPHQVQITAGMAQANHRIRPNMFQSGVLVQP